MNFISSTTNIFRNFFGGKDQYTQTRFTRNIHRFLGKGEDWVDTDGNLYKLYSTTPQLKAVIDRKAAMFSNGIWKHLDSNGEMIENSPFVELLNNPHPAFNGKEFLRMHITSYDVYGNSFIFTNKGISDIPATISVLPGDRMSILRSGKIYRQIEMDAIVEGYELRDENGLNDSFETDEVIHFACTNPNDPIMGESKIKVLMMPISNIRASYGFRNRIITNNAALGILSTDGGADGIGVTLNADEQKKINRGMSEAFGMQEGKSNILQTESNVRWNPMSYPTKDLLLFEEVDANFKMIIDTFGLNKNIFSPESDSKFSNLIEGLKMGYQDCIIPFAEDFANGLGKEIGIPEGEKLELCYDHIPVLQDNEREKAEIDKIKADTIATLRSNDRNDDADLITFE